ncbi:hypothetical protein FGO68_gene8863 [Halteria grandinella]|uniref:Uncharacterized protein n=1 Tax=Halteria grandinella TaxID=5974 RepID=A0A8J8NPQ5_HALGN|nr:hypothetical protein FGO68_gene8863 [Halteria grandinella]
MSIMAQNGGDPRFFVLHNFRWHFYVIDAVEDDIRSGGNLNNIPHKQCLVVIPFDESEKATSVRRSLFISNEAHWGLNEYSFGKSIMDSSFKDMHLRTHQILSMCQIKHQKKQVIACIGRKFDKGSELLILYDFNMQEKLFKLKLNNITSSLCTFIIPQLQETSIDFIFIKPVGLGKLRALDICKALKGVFNGESTSNISENSIIEYPWIKCEENDQIYISKSKVNKGSQKEVLNIIKTIVIREPRVKPELEIMAMRFIEIYSLSNNWQTI